ncbi:MAG TPA: choice-of-anchor D domain-containing protein [Candidatus Kapabacteria bacterium]|nr:choice-of-anchor D domain-containing protein [Candidatus Kapabacteria bacterium]
MEQYHASMMKKLLFILGIVSYITAAYCQPPQIIQLPANSNAYISTPDTLRNNTRYLLQVQGTVSYWQANVPAGEWDADGAFLNHIPYIPGISSVTIDSINASIKTDQYLPCDGSTCYSIPPAFGCPQVPDVHTQSVYRGPLVYVDRDYLDVNDGQNDGEFCPRNGADKVSHTYWEGLIGHGQPAIFHFNDGDGDYQDNAGSLTVTIVRLEPILYTDSQTVNFGRVRCNSGQRVRVDTIKNIGSPIFPGCNNAVANLDFTKIGISGDTGSDGFIISGLNGQNSIPQGGAVGFNIYFNPKRMKFYKAVIHDSTNDPQMPVYDITLTGEGVQGLLAETPHDTLDFGDVPINVTSSRTVDFNNIGTDVLQLTGITRNNNDTTFGFTPPALKKLAVGSTLVQTFTFSPTKLITYFDSVTVSSDSYNGSQRNFYLKGRGVAAILDVDTILDFGNVPVGNTLNQNLNIVNIGNLPLGAQLINYISGDSLDFTALPQHVTINSGDTVKWNVAFHPTQVGRRFVVARILGDGGSAKDITFIGNGTGTSSMTVTPVLNFGIVALGADSIQAVVLHNTGKLPITVVNMTLDDPSVWAIGSAAPLRMVPGDSLRVNVTFTPLLQRSYTTLLHFTDDSARQYVTLLKGSGQDKIGILNVADTVDFGTIFAGDTASNLLTLSNVGIAQLTLPQMSFTQPANDFSDSVALPVLIAPIDSGVLPLFFHPITPGAKTGTLEISDNNVGRNDSVQHVHDIVLVGNSLPSIIAVLSIDTTYSAAPGSNIAIPVNMQTDISAANATSFKITLRFNGALLVPLSLQPGSMLSGYNVTMNEASPGNLVIQGTGSLPISGTGTFVTVTYLVLSSGITQTPIDVASPVIGNGVLPRKILAANGKFVLAGQCGSGVVSPSQATQLTQNVPNPFSGTTVIEYRIAEPTHVTIGIYDALGRVIAEPVDQVQNTGLYSVPFDASRLNDGIYYCRMTAGQYVVTKAMMLMRQ